MKKQFLQLVKTVLAPVALTVAMAVFSPITALAEGHGGGHGFSGGHGGYGGGHSFAGPRGGNFGGGRAFSAPARGFNGGLRAGGGAYYGGRGYYGSRGYYGGRYYGPGFGFGFYAPYAYAPRVCNPGGFYDQYGVWRVYPGCAVPYGY